MTESIAIKLNGTSKKGTTRLRLDAKKTGKTVFQSVP